MIDYLAWFEVGTTGKKAFEEGSKVYLASMDMCIGIGLMRLKEDYLIRSSEILFKGGDGWETRDIQVKKGQYCLYYRASFGEQRDMEDILQDISPYHFTLLWGGNEIPSKLLESALTTDGTLRSDWDDETPL